MIMTGFGVGSLAPVVLGVIKPVLGLSWGITSLSVIWIVCGVLLILTNKFYFKKDYDKVHLAEQA